jgi:hypothetical protein
MDIIQLENLVNQGLSQYKIADIFGCSQSKIKYWCIKLGIKAKQKIRKCALCGETDAIKIYRHKDGRFRYRCKKCDNKKTIERFRDYKKKAVEYKGSKCLICGYSKCLASLEFHHRSPDEKDPRWTKMRNWPLYKIKTELDKCDLVCSNCHREIHYGRGEI